MRPRQMFVWVESWTNMPSAVSRRHESMLTLQPNYQEYHPSDGLRSSSRRISELSLSRKCSEKLAGPIYWVDMCNQTQPQYPQQPQAVRFRNLKKKPENQVFKFRNLKKLKTWFSSFGTWKKLKTRFAGFEPKKTCQPAPLTPQPRAWWAQDVGVFKDFVDCGTAKKWKLFGFLLIQLDCMQALGNPKRVCITVFKSWKFQEFCGLWNCKMLEVLGALRVMELKMLEIIIPMNLWIVGLQTPETPWSLVRRGGQSAGWYSVDCGTATVGNSQEQPG